MQTELASHFANGKDESPKGWVGGSRDSSDERRELERPSHVNTSPLSKIHVVLNANNRTTAHHMDTWLQGSAHSVIVHPYLPSTFAERHLHRATQGLRSLSNQLSNLQVERLDPHISIPIVG